MSLTARDLIVVCFFFGSLFFSFLTSFGLLGLRIINLSMLSQFRHKTMQRLRTITQNTAAQAQSVTEAVWVF